MTLSGKACRTFENDIPQSDGLNVRYRAYLDDEGWLRGLDTYYPEKAGEKVSGWRMRYRNLVVNPEIAKSTFHVANPQSFPLQNF